MYMMSRHIHLSVPIMCETDYRLLVWFVLLPFAICTFFMF
uniref:Uncharacterized protein n=1 Tax=Rhizophora mucronata TaxID=61149 RepID=A0A2P2QNC2_RHIMU